MAQKNTLFNYFSSPSTRNSVCENVESNPVSRKSPKNKTPKSKKKLGLSKSPTAAIKKGSVTPDDNGCVGEFSLYDLVWSKLHGYPWWPSLICNHPKLKQHTRGGDVHVQFFDNPPTRSWIKLKYVEPYTNSSEKNAPVKNKEIWRNATEEADKAVKLSLAEREKLIVFSDKNEDSEDDIMDISSDIDMDTSTDATAMKDETSEGESNDDDKENQKETPLQKLLMNLDDSEDDYKPGKDDLDHESESASSGVDSQEEALSSEEAEPESPVKRKRHGRFADKRPNKRAKTITSSGSSVKVNLSASFNDKQSTPVKNTDKNEGSDGDWAHLKYDFLKPDKIKDANRRRPSDPDYNPRTVYVPEDFKKTISPAMKQWWDLKCQNFDCVLFFKVGKFYELYHMDAVTGVNELGLLFMKGEFAHSGFPEISYSRFSSSLVEKGFKVARVEQTETPEMMAERLKGAIKATKFDKVVKREICQVTTKGTRTFSVIEGEAQESSLRYLLALTEKEIDANRSSYGVCFVDTSIGTFHLGEFSDDRYCSHLRTLIAHHPPVQVLYNRKAMTEKTNQLLNSVLSAVMKEPLARSEFWPADKTLMTLAEGNYFPKEEDSAGIGWPEGLKPFLSEQNTLGLMPHDGAHLAISALGAVVWYLQQCHVDQQLLAMGQFVKYTPSSASGVNASTFVAEPMARHMVLDGITLKNLDVLLSSGVEEGSLLNRLDFCCTRFGKRLLRQWLCAPLCDTTAIIARQEAISDLTNCASLMKDVREKLGQLPDLERLLASIHAQGNAVRSKTHPDSRAIFYEDQVYSKKRIQNFISVLNGFTLAIEISKLFQENEGNLTSKLLLKCTLIHPAGKFPDIEQSLSFFYTAFDHDVATQEGRIVPSSGVDHDYDYIVNELKDIKQELDDYLDTQRKFFGCKVTYFGTERKRFQLEVAEASARKASKEHELQSQRKGYKRFVTPKTKELLARQLEAEDQKKKVLKDLSRRIFEQFSSKYEQWSTIVECLSVLDVVMSLARYAQSENDVCKPHFTTASNTHKPFIKIRDGRHPCIASIEGFVSNDTIIGCHKDACNTDASLILVTGPNMGGKSTLMRQLGLLTIMAHMGCHVPAVECALTPVDRIFTRIGASDDIMAGESTFFVELSETSAIFHQATKHSLVLVDELGRGTSTHDGTAIAAAAVRELVRLGCRTLFSTHYHSLVEDFKTSPEVVLRHMACMVENEDDDDPSQEAVTFLYKFEAGACPKSYGFNAARLGGIPLFITTRAHYKAKQIEREGQARKLFRSVYKTSPDLSTILDQIKKL